MKEMRSLPRSHKRKRWDLFFLALPLMALVIMFRYIPLFGWYLAFVDYKVGQSIFKSEFIGLYFFKMLIGSRDMARIMRNSIILSALKTVALILPPAFAILLNELNNRRFRKFSQTITTLPHFISWVIVYAIAYALFTSDGIVNQILSLFGMSQKLLTNKNAVYGFQTAIWIWKNLGWKSIIYVAAIAGIDQGLYEAATVDGANRYQSIMHVTVPGLMPTFVVMLLLGVADFMSNGMEQVYVFENSLVARNIETLELYTYKKGIKLMDYSYATAIGIFQSFISITLLTITNTVAKRVRGESIV